LNKKIKAWIGFMVSNNDESRGGMKGTDNLKTFDAEITKELSEDLWV
jgi:hypothetical protein